MPGDLRRSETLLEARSARLTRTPCQRAGVEMSNERSLLGTSLAAETSFRQFFWNQRFKPGFLESLRAADTSVRATHASMVARLGKRLWGPPHNSCRQSDQGKNDRIRDGISRLCHADRPPHSISEAKDDRSTIRATRYRTPPINSVWIRPK